MEIRTHRLILRPWKKEDFPLFAELNADPRVMEFFPSVLTKEQSDTFAETILKNIELRGWGLWAVSVPQVSDFIGFIGLSEPSFKAHFTPAIEVAWRLVFDYWGNGYAPEGALAVLKFGFENLNLKEIVSFTSHLNKKSIRVMQKIGMHCDSLDDFHHPRLTIEHPLCKHVLYRIKKEEWQKS